MQVSERVLLDVNVDDRDIEVSVRGTYYPARPATSRSYASGGDPAEPASFDLDVTSIRVDGKPLAETGLTIEQIDAALRCSLEQACMEKLEAEC